MTTRYRLRWNDIPHYFGQLGCVFNTDPRSRYRVVGKSENIGDGESDEYYEAQFRNPTPKERWVVLSYHRTATLAMRACGRHNSSAGGCHLTMGAK